MHHGIARPGLTVLCRLAQSANVRRSHRPNADRQLRKVERSLVGSCVPPARVGGRNRRCVLKGIRRFGPTHRRGFGRRPGPLRWRTPTQY
jgi:hypothetical protein